MRTSYRQRVDTVNPYRHRWWCWGLGLSRWRTRGGRQYGLQGGTDGVPHPRRHRRAVTFYRVNEVSYKVSIKTNKQTVGSRLFTVVVVSWLTYTALRQLIFLICNSVENRIYPFVTSLSSSHPARGSVHLPNFKHTQAQFSKHTGVAVAYTPHKGIERMDSIIICVVKNTKARQNLTQYSVFSF